MSLAWKNDKHSQIASISFAVQCKAILLKILGHLKHLYIFHKFSLQSPKDSAVIH